MNTLRKFISRLFEEPLSRPPIRLGAKQRFFIRGAGVAGLSFGMPNFLSMGPGLPGFLPALPVLTLLFPAALFVLALAAPSRRLALRSGFLTALPAFATALYWLGYPLHNQGGVPVLATVPFILALGAYLAVFPALFSLLTRLAAEKISPRSLRLGLLAGVFWFAQEMLCSVLFTGYPWLDLSMAFVPWPMLIQLASFIGAYGLAGFMASLACLSAQALLTLFPSVWPPLNADDAQAGSKASSKARPEAGSETGGKGRLARSLGAARLRFATTVVLGCVIWLGYGWYALNEDQALADSGNSIYVALVQGNIDQDQKWDKRYRDRTIRVYKGLSRDVLDRLALEINSRSADRASGQSNNVANNVASNESNSEASNEASGLADGMSAARQPARQSAGRAAGVAAGRGAENQAPVAYADSSSSPALPLLLIWPETSMPFEAAPESAEYQDVRHFAAEEKALLLFGSPKFNVQPDGSIDPENQASLLGADGRLLGGYSKEHLVPFGEYVPLALDKLPVIKDVFAGILQGVGTFKPGQPGQSFPRVAVGSASLDIGMLICYESIFPELARERTRHANLLVNISNDTWFGRSAAPLQHLYLSALRAVEERRYLARCTNSGISAIIDDRGRIVANSNLFEPAALLARVRLLEEKSPYYRLSSFLSQIFKVFSSAP